MIDGSGNLVFAQNVTVDYDVAGRGEITLDVVALNTADGAAPGTPLADNGADTERVTLTFENVNDSPAVITVVSSTQNTLNEGTITMGTMTGYTYSAADADGTATPAWEVRDMSGQVDNRFMIDGSGNLVFARNVTVDYDVAGRGEITLDVVALNTADGAAPGTPLADNGADTERVTLTFENVNDSPAVITVVSSTQNTLNEGTITMGTMTGYTYSAADADGTATPAWEVRDMSGQVDNRFMIDGSGHLIFDQQVTVDYDVAGNGAITLDIVALNTSDGSAPGTALPDNGADTERVTISFTNLNDNLPAPPTVTGSQGTINEGAGVTDTGFDVASTDPDDPAGSVVTAFRVTSDAAGNTVDNRFSFSGGDLMFDASGVDFETPADRMVRAYVFALDSGTGGTAPGNGRSATGTMVDLSISNVNDNLPAPPSVTGSQRTINEGAGVTDTGFDVASTDPDGGTVTAFRVTSDAAGQTVDNRFSFSGGDLMFDASGEDYETPADRTVTAYIFAMDSGFPSASTSPSATGTEVNLSITNVDDGPAVIAITSSGNLSAPLDGDTLMADLDTTAANGGVDPDGQGMFAARTYEWYQLSDPTTVIGTAASYTIKDTDRGETIGVRVTYTDGGGFTATSTTQMMQAVASSNVAPTLTFNATVGSNGKEGMIDEGTAAQSGMITGLDFTPNDTNAGTTITAASFDLMGTGSNLFEVIQIPNSVVSGTAPFGRFSLQTAAGVALDHETTQSYTLMIRVRDGDGAMTAFEEITVEVGNVNDNLPAPPSVTGTQGTINEGAGVTDTGFDVASTDPDGGTVTTFRVTSDAAGNTVDSRFSFSGGDLMFNASGVDFETTPTVTAYVFALDSGTGGTAPGNGRSATGTEVNLSITNLNDNLPAPPSVTGTQGTINEGAGVTDTGFNVASTDPDGGTVTTFRVTSDAAGNTVDNRFSFTGGDLMFDASGVDFETTPTVTAYVFAVDSGFPSASTAPSATGTEVNLTISNVDDGDATVTIARTTGTGAVTEGDVYTASVTADPDNVNASPATTYSYQWYTIDGSNTRVNVGTNSATYQITRADEGKALGVSITYDDLGNQPPTPVSQTVELDDALRVNIPVPANTLATGDAALASATPLDGAGVGGTLTLTPGDPTTGGIVDVDRLTGATYTYRVYYSSTDIANLTATTLANDTAKTELTVTGSTFVLPKAALEQHIYVHTTFTDDRGNTENVYTDLGQHDITDTAGPNSVVIGEGESISATLPSGGDFDHFTFTLTSASKVTLTMTAVPQTQITIYSDVMGVNMVHENSLAGMVNSATTTTSELSAGTYYVLVNTLNSELGDYTLGYTSLFTVLPSAERHGTTGVDTLFESTATESLEIQGGAGNDLIIASNHGDLIIGGTGGDIISLGSGEDTLIYRFESDPTGGPTMWEATDGQDAIGSSGAGGSVTNGFTKGEDRLVFADVSGSTPITNLAEFLSDDDRPVVQVTGTYTRGSVEYISEITFSFGQAGGNTYTATTSGTPIGTTPLIIRFDTFDTDNLVDITTVSGKVPDTTTGIVTDTSLLTDLFGADGLVVVAADDADTVGGVDII
jgi:hypothetical protein